jgi:hypothetical protein
MNDQAILERIAQHPKCRAVQLADWLDLDLVDVQAALAALIAVGDVTSEPGLSPAKNPCQFYDLSSKFKASDAYKPMEVKARAAIFAAAHADLNKTDRALAFVRERGAASSYELHVVMGLKPEESATSWLSHAVKDGRLARDGKTWTLGAGEQLPPVVAVQKDLQPQPAAGTADGAAQPQPAPPVEAQPHVPAQAGTTKHQPSRPRARAAEPKADAPTVPVYRCALWSDGILEVQKDGATVAALEQAAGESLAAFLARLTVERAAA